MNDTEMNVAELKLSPLSNAADNLARLISELTGRMINDGCEGDVTVGKLKDLTSTVKSLVSVVRDINGLLTESERVELDMNRKKLELADREYSGGDNAVHIVIDGDGEELAG